MLYHQSSLMLQAWMLAGSFLSPQQPFPPMSLHRSLCAARMHAFYSLALINTGLVSTVSGPHVLQISIPAHWGTLLLFQQGLHLQLDIYVTIRHVIWKFPFSHIPKNATLLLTLSGWMQQLPGHSHWATSLAIAFFFCSKFTSTCHNNRSAVDQSVWWVQATLQYRGSLQSDTPVW